MSTPAAEIRPVAKPTRWWLWVALAIVALVAAWAVQTWFAANRPVNILLMGVDEDKTRTDVMVLAHYDPGSNLLNLVSLPRDTLVDIPCPNQCLSPDKLNHAHAYGELRDGPGGPQLLAATTEKFLGIKIDGYVRVDYEAFRKIIDALGGVEIVIDRDMYYEDPYAKPPLKINFTAKKEPQLLNGQKALEYVRFREDGKGDVGRIERTQKFFYAVYDTARKKGAIANAPEVISAVYPHVKTNVSVATAVALAKAAANLDRENLKTASIPGKPVILKDGRWVWAADPEETQKLVDTMIKAPVPAKK